MSRLYVCFYATTDGVSEFNEKRLVRDWGEDPIPEPGSIFTLDIGNDRKMTLRVTAIDYSRDTDPDIMCWEENSPTWRNRAWRIRYFLKNWTWPKKPKRYACTFYDDIVFQRGDTSFHQGWKRLDNPRTRRWQW